MQLHKKKKGVFIDLDNDEIKILTSMRIKRRCDTNGSKFDFKQYWKM